LEGKPARNFTWPIVGNIAIFVSKRETHADFTPIYDYAAVDKVVDHPTLAAMDIQIGAKVLWSTQRTYGKESHRILLARTNVKRWQR
jgi:hypothetical protein